MAVFQQSLERLGQLVAGDLTFLIDPQLVEEALVDPAADLVRRDDVLVVDLCRDGKCLVDQSFDLVQVLLAGVDTTLGPGHGPGEPVRLGLQ